MRTGPASTKSLSMSAVLAVAEVDDAVVVPLTRGEGEPLVRVVGEEPRSATTRQRVHEQVELVDQLVGEHGPHELGAAADVEVAVDVALESTNRVGVVRPDDLAVLPRRRREGSGDDVLGGVVEERRAGIVLRGAIRP